MRDVLFLVAILLGSIASAWIAMAFCGLHSWRSTVGAVVLGCASMAIYVVLAHFSVAPWICAALVLCLGAGLLMLALRRQEKWRVVPGVCVFETCWILNQTAFCWLQNIDPVRLPGYPEVLWLLLLVGGVLVVHRVFADEVWEKAKNWQASRDGILRFALMLTALTLVPMALSFLLWRLILEATVAAGAVVLLSGLCALALALAGCRLLLYLQQQARELIVSQRAQQELCQFMSIIRSQRHDYNLHLHTIGGLIRDGQYEKGQEYIASIVTDSQDVNVMMKIREPIIGALISGYYDMAREQGCELELHIADDLGNIVSTPYDTNRILGNLLQNAIEEVSKKSVRDKRIVLATLRRGGNSVIRVSNAVQDTSKLEHLFEYGFSGKTSHEGIGLNSVTRILELYRGMIYYEITDNRIEFVVRIPNRV